MMSRPNHKCVAEKSQRGITLIALTLATGVEQWTGSGLSVTLPDLAGTLGASADEASWAVTLYSSMFAVSVALTHRLSSILGNRRLLTFAALLYAASSLGCAGSQGLASFLTFRAVEGFAGGVFLARTLVFVTHAYPREQRAGALRQYGALFFLLGRFASPILSGWFADTISWRLLFLVNAPLMIVAAGLFHRFAADQEREDTETYRADLPGILLLLAGVAAFQIVLSRGEIDDWFGSPRIILLMTLGLFFNLLFVAWQLTGRNRQPLLHLHMLHDRGIFSAAVLGVVLGMSLGGSLYIIPQYLRRVESHSALQTGELMSITAIGSIAVLVMVPYTARAIKEFGGRFVLGIALATQMVSMTMLGYLVTSDTPDQRLWLPLFLNGLFVGIAVPALALAAFLKLDEQHASNARAIYYGSRQLGASLGVTAVVALLDRRITLHSSRLIEALFNRNLATIGVTADPNTALSAGSLAGSVMRQSLVLSYADIFYGMAALAAVMLFLLPLLPTLTAKPKSVRAARTVTMAVGSAASEVQLP
jgi:EmrB/QacA subfamily drug resistance transporter